MSKTENNILLFSITVFWAASYIFIKNLPRDLSAYAYLTMTCGIAAALLTVVFFKKFKKLTLVTVGKSSALAVLMLLNLIFDKLGIDRLASSTASVLASSSILIVPAVMIIMKKMPAKKQPSRGSCYNGRDNYYKRVQSQQYFQHRCAVYAAFGGNGFFIYNSCR